MSLFGSKTAKIRYKLASPYHPGMDRAINQIYSTKGIKGVVFQGLSAVEIEYDPSRLTPVDVDQLLNTGLDAKSESSGQKEEEKFGDTPALRAAARAFHAMTQEKDWSKASAAYRESYQLVGSSTIQELALRGEVCMWYGFALKNLYDLESISDRKPPTKAQLTAVMQIKALWTEMLEIYSRIPYEAHRLDAGIVEQIRKHWIMPE